MTPVAERAPPRQRSLIGERYDRFSNRRYRDKAIIQQVDRGECTTMGLPLDLMPRYRTGDGGEMVP